jgi:hypothetical protein
MTRPATVVGGGTASRADLAAAEQLAVSESNRLQTVRARAEKWVAALTGLTGLISTVIVIKGPDSKDISTGWRVLVGLALALALATLAFAIYRAYQAAYGDPGRLDEVSVQPLTGLDVRLANARRLAADEAHRHLGHAVVATLLGSTLVAGAIGISWFAPKPSDPTAADKNVCVIIDGKTVTKIQGTTLTVTTVTPETEIRPCT